MTKQISIILLVVILSGYPAAISNSLLHRTEMDHNAGVLEAQAAEAPFCKVKQVWVTAYTSVPEETDDTPFVTANNTIVKDGIIAANFLPFGTKVQIPAIFGDKVFTVTDRMHARKKNFVDIWMPAKNAALVFGIRRAEIVILD